MRKVCLWSLCSATLLIVALGVPATAQEVNAPPNVVGSGARALGMGSAFIAVADDATAASWNPAGLTQLEAPEISAVLSYKFNNERFNSTHFVDPDGPYHIGIEDLNYFSMVYPIPYAPWGRNLVISLNYQHLYDFDRDIDFTARGSIPAGPVFNTKVHIDYEQSGSLSTISPAFGFEVTDRLALGITMNIWDSSLLPNNEWKSRNVRRINAGLVGGSQTFTTGVVEEDFTDFHGRNYTFGFLYKPTERLSIGGVYHTKFSANLKYERVTRTFPWQPQSVDKSNMRMEFPAAQGLGVAYRFPNDKLTMSFDVTRREWDDFVQIYRRPSGVSSFSGRLFGPRRVSPITGGEKSVSPHKATYTARLGAEYVFVDQTKTKQDYLPSLRAGVFYDQNPASGREATWYGVTRGHGEPDEYWGVSFGAGVLIKNRVNLDFAYQYRWGNDVRGDTLANEFLGPYSVERGFNADVSEHNLYLSTVIYLN